MPYTGKSIHTTNKRQGIEPTVEMQNWNVEQGYRLASDEGVVLTDAHWDVIRYLRGYHRRHDIVVSGRKLDNMLDSAFSDLGGRKYLHRLFPAGPVAQGLRIGGLPVPPNTEDAGFGTSR